MTSRLFNRNFSLLLIITFASGMTAQLANTALPLFLVNDLGTTAAISGIFSSAYTVVACVVTLLCGGLIDRFGRKAFIIGGSLLFALGCIGYIFVTNIFLLMVFRLLQGLGFATSGTAAVAASTDNIPSAQLGKGLAYSSMSNGITLVIGPSLAIILIGKSAYSRPFEWGGIIAFSAIVLCTLFSEDRSVLRKTAHSKFSFSDSFDKGALPAALVMALTTFGISSLMIYGALLAQDKGYSNTSLFFALSAMGMVLIRIPASHYMDRINEYRMTVPFCLIAAVGVLIIAVFHNQAVFLVGGILYGIGLGVVQPAMNTMCMRGVSPDRRGAAGGTFMLGFNAGLGIGGALLGFVIDDAGYNAMLYLCFVVLLAAAAYSFFCARRSCLKK